jgi:DNA-binding winged helix-turn-helix (wHTH) protein/TolB-like protein
MANSRVYAFGPFHYDAEQRLLFRQGEVVPLVPKAIDTLHVLLERRGRVVEKAELMKLVWPDTTVEDVGLARNISLLRKALDDEPGQYIETIPRRGYRFAAEAPAQGPEQGPGVGGQGPGKRMPRKRWLVLAGGLVALGGVAYWQFYTPSRFLPQGSGIASLAVVPFESLSYELDRSAFSRGLSDLLVADLSKLDGVQVISPSTVRRYTWLGISTGLMGRLLGLEVLVEGTAQKVGARLIITARLVDVHTGRLIWAEHYDYPAADLGQIQAEAAREVAAQVGAHLAIHGQFPRSDR